LGVQVQGFEWARTFAEIEIEIEIETAVRRV
jgi:hypothetical protein